MGTPRRIWNGVSTVSKDHPMAAFPYPNITDWRVWYEDFGMYDIAQTDTPTWTLTVSGTAPDTIPTPGSLLFTITGASDDAQLQLDHGHFFITAGKKAIFETKIKVTKASGGTIGQEGWVVGLTEVATGANFMSGPPPLALAFADGWGFLSYDATTTFQTFQGEDDEFTYNTSAGTYVDDTWMTLSIYWDGTKSTFYKNGTSLGTLTLTPPTSVIAPVVFFGAGEAKADKFYCEYMFFANER